MTPEDVISWLLARLHEVQQHLGQPAHGAADIRFSEALDSMGMAEFLDLAADDCGVEPDDIVHTVAGHFTTVADLARMMHQAGILPDGAGETAGAVLPAAADVTGPAWLSATAVHLPAAWQAAETVDEQLGRPPGWFERRTGIAGRRLWGEEDPLHAAASAARTCLERTGLSAVHLQALVVTSEAPPLAVGLAAALHVRLGLPASCVALEVGGACTGLLAGLWLGQRLLRSEGGVLVVAVEAPSCWLNVGPGPEGEAAALFADAAGACLLTAAPCGPDARRVVEVALACDGSGGALLQARLEAAHGVRLHMNGLALAGRAVRTLARAVHELAGRHGLGVLDLAAVVVHGGNGRLPRLLARRLELPVERVSSRTAQTGNLGSVSLAAAWASEEVREGPVIWAAIGAGLTWGAALLDRPTAEYGKCC